MEFLLVRFDDDRQVLVNTEQQGRTNETIQLPDGTYYVSLEAPPEDFSPRQVKVVLKDTTALSPMEVRFEKA